MILENVLAWSLQIALLVAVGAITSAALRLRAPGARLLFWQMVLAAALASPLVRPWKQGAATGDVSLSMVLITQHAAGASRHLPSFGDAALWLLAAGVVVRSLWLAAGFWRLSRYRRHSRPFDCRGGARLLISDAISSPFTFGALRPVVLLPPQFPQLEPEVQEAILAHELLHDVLGHYVDSCEREARLRDPDKTFAESNSAIGAGYSELNGLRDFIRLRVYAVDLSILPAQRPDRSPACGKRFRLLRNLDGLLDQVRGWVDAKNLIFGGTRQPQRRLSERQTSAACRHAHFTHHQVLIRVDTGKRGFVVGQKPDAVRRGRNYAGDACHRRGQGLGYFECLRIDARQRRRAANGSPQTAERRSHASAGVHQAADGLDFLVTLRIDLLDLAFDAAQLKAHQGQRADPAACLSHASYGAPGRSWKHA